MKKLLLLLLGLVTLILSIFLGYSFGFGKKDGQPAAKPKAEILRIGLVADSHNENDLLARALRQAQGKNVNFVIGLGDYTNLGTMDELNAAKKVFDDSKLQYFVIPGDRDGWDSREKGQANATNFNAVFGPVSQKIEENGVVLFLLDDSDIYKGISQSDWRDLESTIRDSRLRGNDKKGGNDSRVVLVFTHKTPFHPDSAHILGEDSPQVAQQAKDLLNLLEKTQPCHSEHFDCHSERSEESQCKLREESKQKILRSAQDDKCAVVSGLFTGDLHFFAQFNSPSGSVKITTIGAVASDRNFQGPRFGILTVFDDHSWSVEDLEIN